MGTNSKIPSGDILPIPSSDLSHIPEDNYATFYNSASSAPTNPKVHLVDPDPTTYVKSNSDSVYETTITPPIKLIDSNRRQQIWSRLFNDKQYPKDLKRYDGNENHWRNAKENWASAISASRWYFMLKSDYVPPDNSDPYAFNTSNLADGYIFNILDLKIPTSGIHQCWNALKRFRKRDPNRKGFIADGRRAWFAITDIY